MELSRLLGLIQYEIQKSYDFVEEIAKGGDKDKASVLHISLEKVELDLPAGLFEKEVEFNRADLNMPLWTKRFLMPYAPDKLSRGGGVPRKTFLGKALEVQLIGPTDKIDNTLTSERTARIKIVLKPILK